MSDKRIKKIMDFIWNKIKNNSKSRWINLATVLIGIGTLMVYKSVSPIIAKYEGTEHLRIYCNIVVGLLEISAAWQMLCLCLPPVVKIWDKGHRQYPKIFRKRNAFGILAFFVIAMFVTASSIFFYPRTEYYAAITEKFGYPVGVGNAFDDEPTDSAGYWAITNYPWKKETVVTYKAFYGQTEIMNDKKYSTAYNMNFFQIPAHHIVYKYEENEIKYRDQGPVTFNAADCIKYREVTEIKYYNSRGRMILKLDKDYKDNYTVAIYSKEDMPQLLNSTLFRIPDEKTAPELTTTQIEVSYNQEGMPETRMLGAEGSNLYGISGEQYIYDKEGRITELCYLDTKGNSICNNQGVMTVTFHYETRNHKNLCAIRYYGDEHKTKKTEGFNNVFCEKFEYDDEHNNLIERRQFDRRENKACDKNGVHIYQYTYQNGQLKQERYLDTERKKTRNSRTNNSSRISYDERYKFREQQLDIVFDYAKSSDEEDMDTKIEEQQDALMALQQTYDHPDEDNEQNEAAVEDGGTKPKRDENSGVDGNKSEENSSDSAKKTPNSDNPFYMQSISSTEDNQENAQQSFNDEGNDSHPAYSLIRYTSWENGRVTDISYYGCDDNGNKKPMTSEEGFFSKRIEYNAREHTEKEKYYSFQSPESEKKTKNKKEKQLYVMDGGYTTIKKTYDPNEKNGIRFVEYFDEQETLTINTKTGYAKVEYEYFDQGNEVTVSEKYYNRKNHPMVSQKYGYAIIYKTYDARGYLTREAYYDADEKAVCRTDYGISEILYEYENDGTLIKESYKDIDGKPANRTDTDYGIIHRKYENGKLKKKYYGKYEDKNANPVPAIDQKTGIAVVEYEYESEGDVKTELYMDVNEQPCLRSDTGYSKRRLEYEHGKLITCSFYDTTDPAQEQLVVCQKTGAAIIRYEYEKSGQKKAEYYYDEKQNPIIRDKYKCAGFEYSYDEKENLTFIKYIGLDGNPMIRSDLGYAQQFIEYDKDHNILRRSYLDVNGRLIMAKELGCAYQEFEYNESRKMVKASAFDTEKKRIVRKDEGYAVITYEYDKFGRCTLECFYGKNGNSIISEKYHCAGIKYKYDKLGNKVATTYIGIDKKPMIRRDIGYAELRIEYDGNGSKIGESYHDTKGRLTIQSEGGYASYKNEYKDGTLIKTSYYDTDDSLIICKDTGCAIKEYKYDEYGRTKKVRYLGLNNKPVISTKYQCAGFDYDYTFEEEDKDEKKCRIVKKVKISSVGLNEKIMTRRELGYARLDEIYDIEDNERKIGEAYYDKDGKPVLCKEGGYASYKDKYEFGRQIETRYYDIDGELIQNKDEGYAVKKNEYNQYSLCTAYYYYDKKNQPVINTKYKCGGIKYAYDEKGNPEDYWYLAPKSQEASENKIMLRRDLGYAHIHFEYDNMGNLKKESYFDLDNQPVVCKNGGYASLIYHYSKGSRKWDKVSYFDTENQPVLRSDEGYATEERTYNEYGELTGIYYEDIIRGRLIINTKYGCAGFEYEYDEKGNQKHIQYIGLEGELKIRNSLGYAQTDTEYDDFGNTQKESYYDTKGMSVKTVDGYASYENEYQDGFCIETRYYDENKEYVCRKDEGYAVIRREYKNGQYTGEKYFEASDGTLKLIKNTNYNCAGFVFDYDPWNSKESWQYLDTDEDFIIREDLGYAQVTREYDAVGNIKKEYYLDLKHRLTEGKNGYAYLINSYEDGNYVTRYYDAKDQLVCQKDKGYAIKRMHYNALGEMEWEKYYDTNDQLVINTEYDCAGFAYTYDKRGNQASCQYLGTDEQTRALGDSGIAQYISKYDDVGNETKRTYLDVKGNPVERKVEGYASYECIYKDNKFVGIYYYDSDHHLTLNRSTGYAAVIYGYSERGQYNSDEYYDAEMKPINIAEGYARIEYRYDANGNYLEAFTQEAKDL